MMYQVAMAQLDASDVDTTLRELFPGCGCGAATTHGRGRRRRSRHSAGALQQRSEHALRFSGAGDRRALLISGPPDWQQHVLTLKNLEDALSLREHVFSALELEELADRTDTEEWRRAYLSFVVVGAGSTGVELAGAMGRLLPDILSIASCTSSAASNGLC